MGLPEGKYTFELISHRFTLRARQWINTSIQKIKCRWMKRSASSSSANLATANTFIQRRSGKSLKTFSRKIRAYFPQSDVLYFV